MANAVSSPKALSNNPGKRALFESKRMSPEQAFLRFGAPFHEYVGKNFRHENYLLHYARTKRLAARYLSFVWFVRGKRLLEGMKQEGFSYGMRQRLEGNPLQPSEAAEAHRQYLDGLKVLAKHKAPRVRTRMAQRFLEASGGFGFNPFFKQLNLRQVRDAFIQMREHILKHGTVFPGVFDWGTGKFSYAPGWFQSPREKATAIHEGTHGTKALQWIRNDVPTASLLEYWYGKTVRGFYDFSPRLRRPTASEFDWTPRREGEPRKSYAVGVRVAKFVSESIPEHKQGFYIFLRGQGLSHDTSMLLLSNERGLGSFIKNEARAGG